MDGNFSGNERRGGRKRRRSWSWREAFFAKTPPQKEEEEERRRKAGTKKVGTLSVDGCRPRAKEKRLLQLILLLCDAK